MSLVAFLGAIETGLIYSLVALGVFLAFRILNFPDLTVDGSFAFGAAVSAVLIIKGWNPYAACGMSLAAGCLAGLCTGYLNVRLRVLNILASILTMIALYSVNIRLAAVVGGAALLPVRSLIGVTLACVVGSLVYHVVVALALNATTLGLTASDVNIVTAALVCLALVFSGKAASLGGRVRAAR